MRAEWRAFVLVPILALFVAPHHVEGKNHMVRTTAQQMPERVVGCVDLLRGVKRELSSMSVSLVSYGTLIGRLSKPPQRRSDRVAAAALSRIDPHEHEREPSLPQDIWLQFFYGCHIGQTGDTVIQRVFRYGMEQTARKLADKGFYEKSQYLWPRDWRGETLMHLAVRSGNRNLVRYLGEMLQDYSIYLIRGKFAENTAGQTPYDLAGSLKAYGVMDEVKLIYEIYRGYKAPRIPVAPELPASSNLDLYIRPDVPKRKHGDSGSMSSKAPESGTPLGGLQGVDLFPGTSPRRSRRSGQSIMSETMPGGTAYAGSRPQLGGGGGFVLGQPPVSVSSLPGLQVIPQHGLLRSSGAPLYEDPQLGSILADDDEGSCYRPDTKWTIFALLAAIAAAN